jgi:GAF domain-containing protein
VAASLSAPITINDEPVGTVRVEGESNRAWTGSEAELVNSVAGQVARQIENIRLLAQAEQFRAAAEEAARRLTREGWADYAELLSERAYVYDGEQVSAAESVAIESENAQSRPIVVQGESIGEIVVEGVSSDDKANLMILESVANRLSAHLENLRLAHQTQIALADTQTLYETSARLNAANSLEETLNVAAGPGIAAGAGDALLFVFDLDSSGKPEWMEVRANWAGETAIALPVGVRFYIPSYPLARLFINNPDEIVLIDDIEHDPRIDSRLRTIFEQTQLKAVAAMPLTIGGRWVGLIIVNWTAAHKFNPGDSQLYKSLTTQAAIVVDNRILFDQTQAALAESRQLYDASRRLAASVTLQEILATLVESVPITTVNRAVLMSYERGPSGNFTGALVAANWHSGQGALPTEIGTFYPADTFRTLKLFLNTDPAFFDDVQNDPRVEAPTRAVFAQQNVRGAALLPLWVTGRQLGIVLIQCEEPHHFDEPEIRPYTSLAQQLAIAVENRRLFEQTQVALSETQTLYNVSAQLNAATTVHEILFAVVQAVVGSEVTSAVLRSYERDELGQPKLQVLKAAWASDPGAPVLTAPLGSALNIADYPFAQLIAESASPVLCTDILNDPRVDPASRDSLQSLGVRTAAFLPLVYGGQNLGYVHLTWNQPREFVASEVRLFGTLSIQAAVAINNRLLFEQAQKRAERETIINVINQKIQSATSVESAIQTAVRELGQIFKAKRAVVELTAAPERNNGH